MPRHAAVADRMADAVVKRLTTRRIAEIKDEKAARAAIRHAVPPRRARRPHRRGAARCRGAQAAPGPRQADHGFGGRLPPAPRQGEGEAGARPRVYPLMRMSRERIFSLADRIVKELGSTAGV